jgi:drug/metabolite transporter (DMT)-like permease
MYAIAMLVSGTFCTVIMKAEYSIISEGTELCINPSDPSGTKMTSKCPFDKPWFGVLQMKLAMSFCLVFLYLKKFFKQTAYLETPLIRLQKDGKKYINTPEVAALQRKAKRSNNEESTSLLRGTGTVQEGHVSLKTMLAVSLPSLLDLIQTVLANVGLLWISSSVFQMARGSMIVFSAFFSVTCMHKRLFPFHYVSILIVTISVVLVGMAGAGHGTEQSTAQSSHALLGLLLIILAQVFCAMQIVVEEHLMISLNVSPMLLVGLEGLWGLLFYIILVPILTLTPHGNITPFAKIWHEDFYDSFVKIKNSNMLWWMIFIYIIAVGTLNVSLLLKICYI